MLKAVVTVTATIAGAVAVLVYQPGVERRALSLDGQSAAAPGDAAAALTGKKGSGKPAAKPAAKAHLVTGTTKTTPAGPVQIRVAFQGKRIIDVQMITSPTKTRHSIWLSAYAAKILRSEVLQAQSADVDMVSGATYTSQGYLHSLQAALDKKG